GNRVIDNYPARRMGADVLRDYGVGHEPTALIPALSRGLADYQISDRKHRDREVAGATVAAGIRCGASDGGGADGEERTGGWRADHRYARAVIRGRDCVLHGGITLAQIIAHHNVARTGDLRRLRIANRDRLVALSLMAGRVDGDPGNGGIADRIGIVQISEIA